MRCGFHAGVFGICAALVLLTSCHERREESPSVAAIRDNMPPMLLRIDEQADGIVATVPTGDWPRVFAYVRDINDAWADYEHPTTSPYPRQGRPPGSMLKSKLAAAVAALQREAMAQNPGGTVRAANEVSGNALDLFDYYRPGFPPDLRRLRVLERQVVIDAEARDFNNMSGTLNRITYVWRDVRPTVLARADDATMQAFEDNIAAQEAALRTRDAPTLAYRAGNVLALLDEIQHPYP